MKQIAIRKGFSYFYTDSDEIQSGAFDEKLEALEIELERVFNQFGLVKDAGYTTFYGLDKYSIMNCEKCGHLMVNRDKNPTGLSGNQLAQELEYVLYDGGDYQGKALCEECLPFTHRWGHHS